ncbi:MAG: hypothetical protein KA116_03625 [Proteobacteria bacterium]|nr:hypothetical protein [Pseudomonadota bacterium]
MLVLKQIQESLEKHYGLQIGSDVRDFVKYVETDRSQLIVKQNSEDIDLAILLDRDIFVDWKNQPQNMAETFEEISHFVYLAFNHLQGRNITPLEMELQSEIDRVLLVFHSDVATFNEQKEYILRSLLQRPYADQQYEFSRQLARNFVANLSGGNPSAWTKTEFDKLRRFYHSDLSEKLYLARKGV